MRIESDGRLTHLTGSPYAIGAPTDQFTASDVSVDGRFLFVTAGRGSNQGVWSSPLNTNGTLASRTPVAIASNPVPVGVEVAPSNRHLYVAGKQDGVPPSSSGSGGVSGYSIGSNGSLTRILGAFSASSGTPLSTGGQQPVSLDMVDRLPTFLYVGNVSGASIGAFSADSNNGLLTPIGTAGAGGSGDAHFGTATTTTSASSIVNRDRTLLRFNKTPGAGGYTLTVGASGSTRIFSAPKPRRIVPVPGSGCIPSETDDIRSLGCTTTNVSEVRVFTNDGDNTVRAQNGVPEFVICGTAGAGFDTVFLDALTDPTPFNCESVSRAPVGVGTPAVPIGRSARVEDRVAALRLRCAKTRQGGRCKGRVVVVRCPNNRPRARCKDRLVIRPVRRGIGRAAYNDPGRPPREHPRATPGRDSRAQEGPGPHRRTRPRRAPDDRQQGADPHSPIDRAPEGRVGSRSGVIQRGHQDRFAVAGLVRGSEGRPGALSAEPDVRVGAVKLLVEEVNGAHLSSSGWSASREVDDQAAAARMDER